MRVKNLPVTFKAGPEDGLAEGEFIVYPSTFTRQPDAYGDVVAKGAFAEDIAARKEAGIVLPGLYGHRMDDPDFFVAAASEESEDDHGWRIKGAFDLDSPKGAQVYRLVKGKRVNQLSFAYDVLEEGKTDLGDGETANELRKLRVYEFSFALVGANQDTSVVAVKDATAALARAVDGAELKAVNLDSLRKAQEVLAAVIAAAEGDTDQEKASGTGRTKDEEPKPDEADAKSEESRRNPSVDTWATEIEIIEAEGAML